MFGLSLVLLGLPVYYLRARKKKEMGYADH
jgi:cbb3-type cytochrome oxidase subunit 3